MIFKQQFGRLPKQFGFPTVLLFGHFSCKCRALPKTCTVRHKPWPYNNLAFASLALPKKRIITNTWRVEGTMNAYNLMIAGLLFNTIYWLMTCLYISDSFLLLDVLWAYSPFIHLHFGIPSVFAKVRRTVGPVLEAQQLQGDSDKTLRCLGQMRESLASIKNHGLSRSFSGKFSQKYPKNPKNINVKTIWANEVETLWHLADPGKLKMQV